MLVTFILSWLLAAEPAQPCSPACAAVAMKAAPTHQCTPALSGDCEVAKTEAESPAILSFEASWCAPCQQMRSVLARLKQSGVRVQHVDVDCERELASKYRVTSIPAFVTIANGREAARATGVRSYNELMRLAGQAEMEPRTMKATAALAPGAIRAEILVRATYELEPERAKALPALLETFGIAAEVRQDGGLHRDDLLKQPLQTGQVAVTITTVPEAQRVIGQFLSVLSGSTTRSAACAPQAGCPAHDPAEGPVRVTTHCARDCRENVAAAATSCERDCGDQCTNVCGGECTSACEDGVPRGVAVPPTPGCPLVPPVCMSASLPAKPVFGVGVHSNAGVVGSVVLDEPPVPSLVPLATHRVSRGTGAFYTLVLTGDRGLISEVTEYIETKMRSCEDETGSKGRLLFGGADARLE